jgi:hypothetical protein
MYNAILTVRRSRSKEPSSGYPAVTDSKALRRNMDAMMPLLRAATVWTDRATSFHGISLRAKCGLASHTDVIAALEGLEWANEESFRPDLAWLKGLTSKQISEWVVVMPQPKASSDSYFNDVGPFGLHGRVCSDGRIRGNSDSSHRLACATAASEKGNTRGYFLLYPVIDKEKIDEVGIGQNNPKGVVMAISLHLPGSSRPSDGRVLTFTTRDASRPTVSMVQGD